MRKGSLVNKWMLGNWTATIQKNETRSLSYRKYTKTNPKWIKRYKTRNHKTE